MNINDNQNLAVNTIIYIYEMNGEEDLLYVNVIVNNTIIHQTRNKTAGIVDRIGFIFCAQQNTNLYIKS